MRITPVVASIGLAVVTAALSTTAYGNYPPSGNVTELEIAKGPYAMPADDVTFVVKGTGNCKVQIMGVPGAPAGGLRASGPLPLTVHTPVYDVGTFPLSVEVSSDSANRDWCTGQGKAKSVLYVGGTITGVTLLDAPAKSAPRPEPDVHYAGEHLQVKVTGTGSAGANNCGYTIGLQEVSSSQVSSQGLYDGFGTWEIGPVPAPGKYRVIVTPYKPAPAANFPACNGKAELNEIPAYRNAGWVIGLKLEGLAYHFNMGDNMAMPQFCQSCDSIFSPAHDRAFLGIQPIVFGSTPGPQGTCAYNVVQSGNGAPGTIEASYHNGQGLTSLAFPTQLNPPFWNMYDNDVQTITVTITVAQDLLWPSCNILHNPITKTITWTKNTNLRPVFVQ
jgi:hypothetical protein